MPLTTGQTLTFYEILGTLGAGGMGEVYRARDTRLEREVAIKVLPEELAHDEERLRRFEREAKTLASLNHPNIAGIHGVDQDDGVSFLALELVPGEDLATRIANGALPMDEALDVCRQIAEGLEAAHEAGVVHRDLKPANVRITPEGVVKILDFGLAKPIRPKTAQAGTSNAERDSFQISEEGLVLGTPTYMSPEQARGKPVDKRTDVWGFGCVLFECLTGTRAFGGSAVADILAAVLERGWDRSALPAATPAHVRALLERCLDKDPRQRLRDIGEARVVLEKGPTESDSERKPIASRSVGLLAGGAIAVFLLGATAARLWFDAPEPTPERPLRFEIQLPPGVELPRGEGTTLAVAPDGSSIVFLGQDVSKDPSDPSLERGRRLYVRHLDGFSATPIPGTDSAWRPFFSTDGRWIGFEDDRGRLQRVSLSGEGPYTICSDGYDGSWGEDGFVTFVRDGSIWRVSATGGEPEPVANSAAGGSVMVNPIALGGGEALLFESGMREFGGVGVLYPEDGEIVWASRNSTSPMYASTKHIIFPRSDTLIAVPFDIARRTLTGPAVPVLTGVRVENGGAVQADLSENGVLAYVPADSRTGTQLSWLERGEENEAGGIGEGLLLTPITQDWRIFSTPRISPEGTRIAVVITDGGRSDVWLVELGRDEMRRVTNTGDARSPVWSPDGRELAFATGDVEGSTIWSTAADGGGFAQVLLESELTVRPETWHPNGFELVFQETSSSHDLYVLDRRDGSRSELAKSEFHDYGAVFSPDGKFLAYTSTRTGVEQVYVRPYPGPGPEIAVTTDGGRQPVWSKKGPAPALYYHAIGIGHLFHVTLELEPRLRAGKAELVAEGSRLWGSGGFARHYDAHSDGERLLVLSDEGEGGGSTRIRVVVNWFTELREKFERQK